MVLDDGIAPLWPVEIRTPEQELEKLKDALDRLTMFTRETGLRVTSADDMALLDENLMSGVRFSGRRLYAIQWDESKRHYYTHGERPIITGDL